MATELDALRTELAGLTTLIREHSDDRGTLDFDNIRDQFQKEIDALVAAQVKAAMASLPQRRGAGLLPFEAEAALSEVKGTRYARYVRGMVEDGKFKDGPVEYKPIDLWIARRVLQEHSKRVSSQQYSDDLDVAVRALTSTGSGTGDEIVPTEMAAGLWEDFFLNARIIASMLPVQMPSNPFNIPLGLGDVVWRKGTENTATTSSDPATAKSVLTATEQVAEVDWSYTLNEDAVIAMAPTLRARLALSGGEAMDAFALNADATNAGTGNINLDDADPPDDSYYLSDGQDGLRHLWLADNTGQQKDAGGDGLDDADITAVLSKMGKYAVNPEQARMICDVSTYLNGFLATGTGAPGEYVKSIGDVGFSIITAGQIASYRGIPIIVSASHPLCEADGKVSTTPGNNTLGSITFFNRNMWYIAFKRGLLIEVDRDIQKRSYIMVVSFREAVAAHGTRASATHTAGIRNILV